MKKICSILIVAVMLIGMLSAITIPAFAETSGTTGDCTWSLNGTKLTISGNGKMGNFGRFEGGIYWESNRQDTPWGMSVTEVVIESGVTSIGICAFYGCSELTSITIPDSIKTIGYLAFAGCKNIKSVHINDLVSWCKIYFQNGDVTENSTSPLRMPDAGLYLNGNLLTEIEYPVELGVVGNAFSCYGKLKKVIIPTGITEIAYGAFSGCSNLTSISIPESVISLGYEAFLGCKKLTEINIPDGYRKLTAQYLKNNAYDVYNNPDNWENGQLYLGKNLLKVENSNDRSYEIKDGTVAILNRALSDFENLTSITIPQSVTIIDEDAFYNCGRLTDVYYGGTKDEWKKVFIGNGNESFLRAEIHYTEPHNPFTDVKADQYYAEPVLWAVSKGITNGTSASTFSPDSECTRGQIVTFLWRAAGSPEPTSTKNPFVDVKSNQYYYKAVLWAVEKGITTGTSSNTFSPDAGCTRGQVVTFLHRAKGKPAASGNNAFKDVKAGAYYSNAVLWAVKNEITNGMSATSFAPDATCTRGQIVTFLYRAYK